MLAREAGDRDGAHQALRQFLDLPAEKRVRDDPWWIYFMGSGRRLNTLAVRMWMALLGAETQ